MLVRIYFAKSCIPSLQEKTTPLTPVHYNRNVDIYKCKCIKQFILLFHEVYLINVYSLTNSVTALDDITCLFLFYPYEQAVNF